MNDIIDLEKLDCNCNECVFMERDLEKFHRYDALYDKLHGGHKQSWRIHYGKCIKFDKEVQFTPNLKTEFQCNYQLTRIKKWQNKLKIKEKKYFQAIFKLEVLLGNMHGC